MAKDSIPKRVKAMTRPAGMPFAISKIGHVVLQCRDIERTVKFYTEVLGFKVSDVYPDEMVPGGMVFMRCASDHHGVGFVGSHAGRVAAYRAQPPRLRGGDARRGAARARLSRARTACRSTSRAGAAPARRSRSSSAIPTATGWRSSGASTRSASDGKVRPAAQWKWAHSLEDAIADPCEGQDTTLADPSLLRRAQRGREARATSNIRSQTQRAKLGTPA